MKIHYFQRYHQGEDRATANTMLMLSRLYTYSADKFFRFLKDQYFADNPFEPEITFNLQEKSEKSRPDATITQESFKIVVETKLTDWFHDDQLVNHLESFKDEKYKVLITLSSEYMNKSMREKFESQLKAYNKEHETNIIHVNTTFADLANGIQDVLDPRDYELQDVLDDYLSYCYEDNLISDAWKKLRVQLAGTTFDFNMSSDVYYDNIERGFAGHDFLGLYKDKSVRGIGKVVAIIAARRVGDELEFEVVKGEITEERKEKIRLAIEDGKSYGYNLDAHNYFFVEKFYETDFKKVTKYAPMGSRVFDLTEILGIDKLPSVDKMAEQLRTKSWT